MRDPRFDYPQEWGHREATPDEIKRVRAEARAVAVGPASRDAIEKAETGLRNLRISWWHIFQAELVATIREDPARQQSWADMLQWAVEQQTAALPSLAMLHGEAAGLLAAADRWKKENYPLSIWEHRSSRLHYWRENILPDVNLLIRIDPVRGLRVLDALPFPGMMEHALRTGYDFREDRNLIEALLAVSPVAFDEHGTWQPTRSVAALLATDLVVGHAQRLNGSLSQKLWNLKTSGQHNSAQCTEVDEALRQVQTTELPNWMRRAFRSLLQRRDGKVIAINYAAHIARQVLTGHGMAQQAVDSGTADRWSPFAQGLDSLSVELRDAGVGVAQIRRVWSHIEALERDRADQGAAQRVVRRIDVHTTRSELQGEGARKLRGAGLPYLFGAAVMLGNEPKSEDELRRFWSWFEELVDGRDPGLRLVTHADSIVAVPLRLGFLLAQIPEPADVFQKTYDQIEPQRRRAQHAFRYEDFDLGLESTLLVRVGLHAAEFWHRRLKTTGDNGAPRQLFYTIYASARRLWLTGAHDFDGSMKALIPLCFAFMPVLFGDQLGPALAKTIPLIANNPRMLADACWFLWRNGVEPRTLAHLVREAGGDLEDALRDIKQWTDLVAGDAEQREREFPSDLQQLAEALGLSFHDEEPAPESARMAQRRKEFHYNIPWGAALLRRLDEDGLSRIQFRPMDAGTTWLVQADTPNVLRERFGLSPQVRILVVHGQVRGRDLRLAVHEPRDAAYVDPDLIIVASDWPVLHENIRHLAGPWGQRIPWTPEAGAFIPIADALRDHLPRFDLFDRRDPIRGRALIGRREHVNHIAARLLNGQAVAVLGLRKVGKSSLLQAVAARIDPIGAERGMFGLWDKPMPDVETEALVVSFDVQGLVNRTLQGLAEKLANELRARLALVGVREAKSSSVANEGLAVVVEMPGKIETSVERMQEPSVVDRMEELERLLHLALNAQPRPIAFVLDEYDLLFEGYGGEPGIPDIQRFFALLRSLSQATGRISLALIGRDPVFVQRPHLGGFTSPLLGWVEPTWLGPLRRDEADELLVRLGKRTCLDVGPMTLETAWRWTGGHPLLLREYGSALFELAHAPPSRPQPVETDALCQEAVEMFWLRDGVQTICGEVQMLLEVRFQEALSLLGALAGAPPEQARDVIEQHGGPRGSAAATLLGFGLIEDLAGRPWVPELWRSHFRALTPRAESLIRSGTGGE